MNSAVPAPDESPTPDDPTRLHIRLMLPERLGTDEPAVLWPLIEESAQLLLPHDPEVALRTSEPRSFSVASGAYLAARQLLADGKLTSIHLGAPPGTIQIPGLEAELWLRIRAPGVEDVPVGLALYASAALHSPSASSEVRAIVDVVKRWVSAYDASQGVVSTKTESQLARIPDFHVGIQGVRSWTATRRYLQAIGWGTFLGPDLAARLGGPESVAARAPCWRAEIIGQGVFLQSSPAFAVPAPDDVANAMLEFLRPLLPTEADAIPPTRARTVPANGLTLEAVTSPAGASAWRWTPGFVTEIVEQPGSEASVEIRFRTRPPAQVREDLGLVLDAWYRHDLHPLSVRPTLGSLSPPSFNGRDARWAITALPINWRGAIARLADRLEAFSRLTSAFVECLSAEVPATPAERDAQQRARRPRVKPAFPVKIVDQSGVDATFNLYFASPLTSEQETQLKSVLTDWYAFGFDGGYGEAGFHDMYGPIVDGQVARWHVDLGTADDRRAFRDLARRLQHFSAEAGIPIERLTIGEELVE